MAERRMFAKTIIDSDAFIDMPLSAQALYFHLGMRADDDGFINGPKKVQRMVGASEDDLKLLIGKKFIIPFDSGVVVIKHWKVNNYIRPDRYTPTVYTDERAMVFEKENRVYTLEPTSEFTGIPSDNQMVYQMDTQCSVDQIRLNQISTGDGGEDAVATLGNETLTQEQYNSLTQLFPKAIVDYQIERIISRKYKWCLNEETLKKWCSEFITNKNMRSEGKKTAFDDFDQRNYDYDQLEKNWLNQGKEVQV